MEEDLLVIGLSQVSLYAGKGPATKSDDFLEKMPKGGAVIFNPKFVLQILGTGLFDHEIELN